MFTKSASLPSLPTSRIGACARTAITSALLMRLVRIKNKHTRVPGASCSRRGRKTTERPSRPFASGHVRRAGTCNLGAVRIAGDGEVEWEW